MGSIVSKWVIPGIITVLIGTAIAVFFGQANVQSDLSERANAVISNAGDQGAADWAQISFDGRDGTLSGTSTEPDSVQPLIDQLSALHGVRSITSEVIIAPTASPYPFSATLENGEITLTGGVPSIRVRDEILAETGAKNGGLELMSGVPAGDWKSVALFAVSRLETLVQGEATLADMDLRITGVAKTPLSYVEATSALGGDLPNGISLITASIEPALVEDFTFVASRSDGVTTVSGYVPDRLVRASIGALSGASTESLLEARGAPEGFATSVQYGLKLLNTMSQGSMEISAAGLSVSGTAASQLDYGTANALAAAPPADGLGSSDISIIPATQENYFWSTQKRGDGSLTLRGYVPDESTRSALLARAGGSAIDKMQIANGAPATFYEDALVSISALKNLETGQAGFRGNGWYLRGNPALQEDADAAEQALITARTPASKWRIAIADAPPVPVIPYTWSARKSSAGQIVLKGNVPDEQTRNALLRRAGDGAEDNMVISFGAPDSFYEDALVAISALNTLESGRAGHGLNGWYVSGQPLNVDAAAEAENALITARTPSSQWRIDLAAPLEVEAVVQSDTEPAPSTDVEIATVVFSAKLNDGSVALSGQVPDRDARNILGLSAGASTTALNENPAGLPETFLQSARTGITALRKLSEGSLSFSAGAWTLSGVVPTTEALGAIAADLAASGINWNTKLNLPSPEVICQNRSPQFEGAAAIQFKTGSAQIAAGSMPLLQRLADYLNQCPALQLSIEGRTDSRSDAAANLKLSSDRAGAVKAVLAGLGVEQSRMLSVGFGDTGSLEADDDSENRLIVFKINP